MVEAAQISKDSFGISGVEFKSDGSVVTDVDRKVEELFRGHIQGLYPTHRILGEEYGIISGGKRDSDSPVWIIDPIDGTESYSTEIPTYALSLACYHEGKCLYSIVSLPFVNRILEFYSDSVWVDGKSLDRRSLPLTTILASSNFYRHFQVGERNWSIRCLGSFCFHAGYLVLGLCQLVLTTKASAWDLAGLYPMLISEGFCIYDATGKQISPDVGSTLKGISKPFLICEESQKERFLGAIKF
jgi:fructose-1,6-bisphosphatase/inositol monophosphatase family enzyme